MPFDFHRLKSGYHAELLKGRDGDLDKIAEEMSRYPATANVSQWFAAWDREAIQRAFAMERDVGLASGPVPTADFIDAARRAIVFELGGTLRRQALASVAAV
jgi:hypothetical protein